MCFQRSIQNFIEFSAHTKLKHIPSQSQRRKQQSHGGGAVSDVANGVEIDVENEI